MLGSVHQTALETDVSYDSGVTSYFKRTQQLILCTFECRLCLGTCIMCKL